MQVRPEHTECSCTLATLPEEEVLHLVDAKCTRGLKLYTDAHGRGIALNGYKECLELCKAMDKHNVKVFLADDVGVTVL